MRNLLIGALTTSALAASGAASAGDLAFPRPCGPNPCGPAYSAVPPWTGAYIGMNLGYQSGTLSNSGARPSGFAGGFQGGYNWQVWPQLVLGLEADLQLSNSSDTFADYKFSNPWFGTVRGRGGIALDNILFYGTLGLAYGRGHVDIGSVGESNFHVGWTAGAGLEVGLSPHWSVKAEYLFIDLASESYGLTLTNNGLTSNLVRFGVNYKF